MQCLNKGFGAPFQHFVAAEEQIWLLLLHPRMKLVVPSFHFPPNPRFQRPPLALTSSPSLAHRPPPKRPPPQPPELSACPSADLVLSRPPLEPPPPPNLLIGHLVPQAIKHQIRSLFPHLVPRTLIFASNLQSSSSGLSALTGSY